MQKWRIVLFIVLIVIGAIGAFYFYKQQEVKKIRNFDECAKAGFPILETYPSQCRTSDGRSFSQDIGNELNFSQEINISNPRPNQVISSPLKISGKAKGMWYFEGSFSGELFDQNNKSLGKVVLSAQEEWMSEDFVPFDGTLEFEKPATLKGKLIIKNANPSGLPENEKVLILPIKFK